MARGNKEAQGKRSKRGKAFEIAVADKLETFMENRNLDERFRLERQRPFLGTKVDHAVTCRDCGEWLVAVGEKVSFRERWMQDAWMLERAKPLYPRLIWCEITESEKTEDPADRTRRNILRIGALARFDFVMSTTLVDTISKLFNGVEAHLRSHACEKGDHLLDLRSRHLDENEEIQSRLSL